MAKKRIKKFLKKAAAPIRWQLAGQGRSLYANVEMEPTST